MTKEKIFFFYMFDGEIYTERESLEKIYGRLPEERFLMIEKGSMQNYDLFLYGEKAKTYLRKGPSRIEGEGITNDRVE